MKEYLSKEEQKSPIPPGIHFGVLLGYKNAERQLNALKK
jgi:hypothetical protein